MTKKIATLLIAGLVLAACSTSAPADKDVREATPQPTHVQSSGNADEDVQKVEAELDSLDIDSDFPSLSQNDLEQ